jgi:two-component system, response regulator RegA
MTSTFLILDDNAVFAQTLARALARRNIQADIALTGETALEATQHKTFDYLSIDLHLEKDSGLQWIEPLRKRLPRARILVLTAYASIATTVQAIKVGADNYLAKPAHVDAILSALQVDNTPLSRPVTETEFSEPSSTLNHLEWEHIQRVLMENQGNISSTARALNIHRRTLQRKLAKRPLPQSEG